mmetsp:Transcript_52162/g.138066  ORF Transcript_52162/g.138066 Transcript_52162/m.138066 type:complete len:455 (+) Transcript_52162:2425-3789(+)
MGKAVLNLLQAIWAWCASRAGRILDRPRPVLHAKPTGRGTARPAAPVRDPTVDVTWLRARSHTALLLSDSAASARPRIRSLDDLPGPGLEPTTARHGTVRPGPPIRKQALHTVPSRDLDHDGILLNRRRPSQGHVHVRVVQVVFGHLVHHTLQQPIRVGLGGHQRLKHASRHGSPGGQISSASDPKVKHVAQVLPTAALRRLTHRPGIAGVAGGQTATVTQGQLRAVHNQQIQGLHPEVCHQCPRHGGLRNHSDPLHHHGISDSLNFLGHLLPALLRVALPGLPQRSALGSPKFRSFHHDASSPLRSTVAGEVTLGPPGPGRHQTIPPRRGARGPPIQARRRVHQLPPDPGHIGQSHRRRRHRGQIREGKMPGPPRGQRLGEPGVLADYEPDADRDDSKDANHGGTPELKERRAIVNYSPGACRRLGRIRPGEVIVLLVVSARVLSSRQGQRAR